MSRECAVCGKKVVKGFQYTYRGLAKHKGGVGVKVTGKTKRKFRPNLQRVRATVGGSAVRIKVCTRCIKSGKVEKPLKRNAFDPTARLAPAGSAPSASAATE